MTVMSPRWVGLDRWNIFNSDPIRESFPLVCALSLFSGPGKLVVTQKEHTRLLLLPGTMHSSWRNQSQLEKEQHKKRKGEEEPWLAVSLKPENFVPGLVIGFLLGLFIDLSTAAVRRVGSSKSGAKSFLGKQRQSDSSGNGGEEFKMVLIVRQDLKMGAGKIASQCAHAATGMYAELMNSQRSLLRQWEQCGQAKIVLSCKNQQEMNNLRNAADRVGLPTFVVADAGRTQVSAGSRTVLAVGPGRKSLVDSVAGKLRLL